MTYQSTLCEQTIPTELHKRQKMREKSWLTDRSSEVNSSPCFRGSITHVGWGAWDHSKGTPVAQSPIPRRLCRQLPHPLNNVMAGRKEKSGVFPTLRIHGGHLGSTEVLALTKAFKSTVQIILTPSCFQTMANCTDRKFLQKPDGWELFTLLSAFTLHSICSQRCRFGVGESKGDRLPQLTLQTTRRVFG